MTLKKKLLGLLLLLGLTANPLHAVPTIFHCTETAGPGDVIGLQGDSFGSAPQVWIEHVTSTMGSLAPAYQLAVTSTYTNGTVSYASAKIPTTETTGLYAVWVYDGTTYNATPSLINKARAFGAQDLCGTQIDASRTFRLFGRNLYIAGATPTVSFVNGATSLAATVTTAGSDTNILNVKAPAGLVSGTVYTVNVQNGYGGTWGQGSLSYTLTARTSASDPFGLGVPWGADFSGIAANVYNIKTDPRLSVHAVGDGVTNDAQAIQNAIKIASGTGGGVIYFPAGTYELESSSNNNGVVVNFYSNVVLQGAGATQSVLQMAHATAWGVGVGSYQCSHIGFVDIGFDNTSTGCPYGLELGSSTEVFALNSQFQAEAGKDCVFIDSFNVLVEDNTFITDDSTTGAAEQVWMDQNIDQIFKDNTVSWYFSRVRTGIYSVRSLIEGNTLTRNAINNGILVESGGFDISESDSTVVLNNVITKGGTGPLTQNNDGETIMAQNTNPHSDTGTATGSTSTTLIDTTKDWTYNYAVSDTGSGELYYVAILSGPGTGQLRQVIGNTTTSLTVDHPWDILPTSSSNFTLTHIHLIHSLIKGNSLTENTQGIELYKVALEDVTITGNTLTDNGSIWLSNAYQIPTSTFHMDTTVLGNTVSNTLNWYTETGSYAQIYESGTGYGTCVFGAEFRDNDLTAPVPNRGSEGYLAANYSASPATPVPASMLGVIFQNNTAVNTANAYQVNGWDTNTSIWDYVNTNVSNLLLDTTEAGQKSVNTVLAVEPPSPWLSLDIGSTSLTKPGSSWFYNGVYSVAGYTTGDLYGSTDYFRYFYQSASGDCSIVARITGMTNGGGKAGVMIRETLNGNSTYLDTSMSPGGGSATMFYRTTTGGVTNNTSVSGPTFPYWLKVTRVGNTFTGYCSPDGTTWTTIGSQTITMATSVYIGMPVCSHSYGGVGPMCTAVFDNVTPTP
jgi:hypothetical protein